MPSEEFLSTLFKLVLAVVGFATELAGTRKNRESGQDSGKAKVLSVTSTVVILCFLVIFGIEAYSFTRDFLHRSLHLHDPAVFYSDSSGYVLVARVYPDRAKLVANQQLPSVFDATKRDFEIETTSWHKLVSDNKSAVEAMLARKVEMRVLLFDARESNKTNCEALAASLNRTCEYLRWNMNDALKTLSEIKADVPNASLEVKLYRTIPLKNFWIKDRNDPKESIVQVQVLDEREDKRISFRIGRLDPDNDIDGNLSAQFQTRWDQRSESVALSKTSAVVAHQ